MDNAAPIPHSDTTWLPRALRSPPPAPPITDAALVRERYAFFRPRILIWTTIGYGMFYFVRKNYSVAMPVIEDQLGVPKSQLGLILTLHGVMYGISKFANGVVADRANARVFMALALIISAALNVCFGLSSAFVLLAIFWTFNGWVQGMGYPPCARLLSHWFSPKELATKMSFWNASHTLGGGAIVVLCGYILQHFGAWQFGAWRLCFFIPSIIAVITAAFLLAYLRDTPESVGLPEVEGTHVAQTPDVRAESANFQSFLWERVFSNKYIWLVSIANFFVYTIRFAIFDWGTTYLKQSKGFEIAGASWMVASFEVAGLAGMLLTGWLTDRFFAGRAVPICVACMLLCGLSIALFWLVPSQYAALNTAMLMATGFFIYGPQALAAVIVVNLATKRAAATAVGLTSIFGYASTVLSGWGMGLLLQEYGWNYAFIGLIAVAAIGALFFAAALPAKASGYTSSATEELT